MTDHPPILIRAGRVVDPGQATETVSDVLIRDNRIEEIGEGLRAPGAQEIDAEGLLVSPGLIDPHVHLREPGQTHKETVASGTAAAVAGGFTTVCCMPNTNPAIDQPDVLSLIAKIAEREGHSRVHSVAAATKGRRGKELVDFGSLDTAGAVAFSDDGDAVADPTVMRRVMERVAETGKVFMQHCQDPAMTPGSVMHEGEVSRRLGLAGWPREAEETIVERDIALARETGCRYHVQHISSRGTVELIRRARAGGLPVTGEASPHHLILTDDAVERLGSAAKMNPPLREWEDVVALREGVADGTVTVLATDHAPHSTDEKRNPVDSAPFGIIGLETALALYAEALVHPGSMSWPEMLRCMTSRPAELCGLDAQGFGSLSVGGPADVTIIDPEHEWVISREDLRGKSENTPFLGQAVRGRAVTTIVGGGVAFDLGLRSPAHAP